MEQLGPFLGGVGVTVFIVFILTRIARKKYDVVEREKSSGSGGGGGGTGRDIHLK